MADSRRFTYRIDGDGIIRHVSPDWLAFADENNAAHLVNPGVLGKPLRDFITGLDVIDMYEAILDKVRQSRGVVCFAFRCDSPDVRRFMDMVIRPWVIKGVEFTCRMLREEPRAPVAVLDARAARSDRQITMCSWCRRIATPEWVEVEEAINILRLFEQANLPQIKHSVCLDCYTRINGPLEAGQGR